MPILCFHRRDETLAEGMLNAFGPAHYLVFAGQFIEENRMTGVARPVSPTGIRKVMPVVSVLAYNHGVSHCIGAALPVPIEIQDLIWIPGVPAVYVYMTAFRVFFSFHKTVGKAGRP